MQTSCGEIAYPNEWNKCWIEFFFKNRLEFVIGKIDNQELNVLIEKLHNKKDWLFDGAKEWGFFVISPLIVIICETYHKIQLR